MNAVAKALDAKKRRSGMTLRDIAEAIGVSRVSLGTWKKQGYVSNKFVVRFSDVTGANPYDVTRTAKQIRESDHV